MPNNFLKNTKEPDDSSFTLDFNTDTPVIAENKTNTDSNESTDNNYNIVTIIIIGIVSVISCLLLSGLTYLYYHNCIPITQNDSDIETTSANNPVHNNPVDNDSDNIDVTIGYDLRNDRVDSTHSLFMGQIAE